MRKLTLLITMLFLSIGMAWAQFDETKLYRIKDTASEKYLNAANHDTHEKGANGGVNVVALNEASDEMIFIAEKSADGFKLKTKSGYYINGHEWNVDANSTKDGMVLLFEKVGDNYKIKWVSTAAKYLGQTKYFKVQNVGGTIYPFCDAELAAAATWAIEEYELQSREAYVNNGNSINRSDRGLKSFTITDGTEFLEVKDIQTSSTAPVYVDKSSQKLITKPGATLSFSAFSYAGTWMHAYAYVDYNKDYHFFLAKNNNGAGAGELVSYNHFVGYDINGNVTNQGSAMNANFNGSKTLPAFTLPADLAPGEYRMRVKVDWNNIDADYGDVTKDNGIDGIAHNGGCQCDITIVIPAAAIGNKYYASLAEAVNAVQKGQIIKLLADYNGEAIKLPFGVTLDKNGFTANVTEAPSFTGDGTAASPYIINNEEMLVALRDAVNGGETFEGKYFKLTSDIALNGEWTAIGNGSRSSKSYTGNAFKGVFDGDNNTISGLTITSTTAADAAIGLFGVVDGGTVKNLNLEVNINVASSNLAGGAIGMMLNGATAENITVNGAIVGNDGVGGIVGRLVIDGTIANCTNNASVTSYYGGIGGIVGKAYYEDGANTATFASITNCTNKGTITAPMYVGGIAGLARANVSGCVNEGEIVGGTQTGGIVGQLMAAGTVSGNENKAKVSGTSHVGGIIGDYTQSGSYTYNNVSIANNINRGEVSATGDCAAILGCNNVDGFTAMSAAGNVSYYHADGLALFGNPEDMTIDATNKFIVPVAQVGEQTFYTLADAVAEAQSGSEIKLLADVTLAERVTIPADKTLTIDLNGKSISMEESIIATAYAINNLGNLTIKDGVGGGSINARGMYNGYGDGGDNVASATITILGGTFNAKGTNGGAAIFNYGTANVNGGKFTSVGSYSLSNQSGSTMNIADGVEVTGGIYNSSGVSLTVNGGNISNNRGGCHTIYAYNAEVAINGGSFHNYNAGNATIFAEGNSAAITINGGTFSIDNGKQTHGWTSCMIDASKGATYEVNDGTFKGHFRVQANSAMEINGGTFENTHGEAYVNGGTVAVKGGTFTDAAAQKFATDNLADGYKLGANGTVVQVNYVAQIGEKKYETFAEALEATKTMTGDVTVEILDKVTFNQPLIGNYSSINFVGKAENAEMYLDVQGYTTATGKKVSFTDLKLSKSEGGFIANAGFMNVAFGIYDVEEVTYTRCTFENGACASSGKVTFNDCTFKKSWDKYGLWAYGNVDVTVQGSTFADYRGIKMYAENGADASVEKANLTVKNTNFSAVDNKPAIVLTYGESVVLEGNTYSSTGTFELDLDGKPNGVAVTSDVAPVCKNDNGACGVLVDGKIYTTVAQAAEVATETSTVTLLHSSNETVEFPMGTTIEKNGFTADNVTTAQPFAEYIVLPQDITVNNYKAKFGDNTVTDGVNFYATLQAAVEAVAKNAGVTRQADAVLYCKPGADVGSLQHAPVVSTLTVYGNGANVTGGSERDFDLGNTDPSSGKDITADMTLTVKHLNGCGAWGAKATEHTVNLVFENCANMGKVFISGTTGTLNITMTDCAFEGILKEAVYSNADGAITLNNVAFSNLNKAINLNHKAAGTQTVTIDGCSFTNCGNNVAADEIPVRVLSSVEGGKSVLNVSNATFSGTPTGGADILLDYGVGESALNIAKTDANVSVEIKKDVATTTTVSKSDEQQTFTNAAPVAEVNGVEYMTFAEAAAVAQAGSEIKLLAKINGDITVPANVTLNGNGFAISGGILAEGDITFAGVTTAADFDAKVTNTAVNIPAGASLQLTGGDRLVIGHGATFNITGTITDAKTADKATLVPSLKIAAGASITGNGVTFNVNNAYIVANANTTSKNSNANGTLDFNINNSIWEQTGVLAFYVPTSGKDPVVNFELKNSVLTTTSHLVFSVTKGEIVFDNSLVNQGTSRQLENRSTMTIKNGSVVNGAVATSSNAINPGTITVENATYAVTGEFSGAAEGTGTIIIKKGANVSVGSIKAGANVTVDAEGMAAGDEINFTANLSQFTGTLSVINNDKLEAKIVDGKIVLAAKPVAKIGEQGYATLDEAFAAAAEGATITLLDNATPALTSQRAITKAAVIDLNGKTLTLNEDDLYFGTTTFQNGTIVVDPSVVVSTAVFWMFENQTLTFDNVDIVATGVTGTYLIGINGGTGTAVNLVNGSSITIDNETKAGLTAVICDNGTGNNVTIKNSKIAVNNIEGRFYLGGENGAVVVENTDVDLNGVKEGFYLRADQSLAVTGTSTVDITLNSTEGRYGINLTDLTATYTKAETATVNATLYEPAKGSITVAYTSETSIWGEGGGNAKESLVIKVLDANDNVMGTSTLNNVGGIIDGDVYVTWSIMFNAPAPNPEAYWSMEWTTAPSVDNMPAEVAIWVDGVEVGRNKVVLNGPDDLNKIVAAVTDADGKIISCHTSVAKAADVDGVTNIALLRETNEVIELPAGVELNKNNFTAAGVTVKMVAKVGNTEYSSIDKAIEAWTNNTTLTLLDNVTLSDVIQLSSTEYHILDLGTYTMTAASKKDAIQIVNNGRTSASYALDIKANAENPGGITATGKAVVKTTGKSGVKDRPIIRFYNGVFNANNIIQHSGSNGTNSPQFVFYNGVYNGNISTNRAICIFEGGTFNGRFYMSVDSSSYARIGGGTFMYMDNLYGSALNSEKFTIGSAKGVFDRGVYVDDNGCVVIGGAVVTEAGNNFEASSTNYSAAGSYLQYSSAKDNGLYYTAVEEALADNNKTTGVVTVYADEVDMSGINYKGTIVVPVGQTVTIVNAPATPAFTVKSADGYVIEPNENGAYESIALVAKIGDKVYDSFEKAVADAQEGETVTVHKEGTYALKVKNNVTITGAVAGVEFANIGAFGCNGANVTFNNVTFTYAENSTYKGLQHSGNLLYNNCTFNGQVFLYGQSETFNKCTFNTTDSNNYNVWTYGAKNVAFKECTFNSAGKSVLIYAESASITNNVTVTKSQFNASQAVEGKAAIEMDSSLSGAISLTIDAATTASGFGTGNVSDNSLWNNKKGNNDVANNDITVKVGDTVVLAPIFEAQIGDAQYRFFQDAINAVQNGETITVLRDIATNVEIKEKDNVKVTIDGNGMKMTGTIKVVALSSDNDRRITIKNFKFEDTTSASVDFITSVETNHYPRITVEGCTFTGSGDATDVALRLKSSNNVEIKNCTGKGLHSFLQNTSGWNLTIENVTVTESKSAFALGTVQGVTVKGCTAEVPGYGIRMDAGYNNNAVIESNTIKAFIPVVVRKATVNSNIAVNGTNNLTATNNDGIWCAIGTSEYEENGAMPTAATANVVVALNDADLDSKGIYGNALAGKGTEAEPYLINNIGELVLFRNSVNAGETKYNAPGVTVYLAADIDLASVENWSPIGTFDYSFDGNFNGQGLVIKNLKITDNATAANGEAYLGFFGVTANNTIKNFVIENVTIESAGQIVAAAIAYPYYTTVSDITVRGDIAIKGGNYTAGVLAYTRLCQNASNLAVVGNENSYISGAQVVGGVIADIQMNKGLVANYSNFSAQGVTVSGTKNVGGISGIIATQSLNGATVKDVTLNCSDARVGIVAGCLGGTSTISNVTYENVAGATALLGATYEGNAIEAKIGDTYYATLDAALAAEGEATVELFVPVTVATGESRVIDLNGKTVIGTDNATGSFALININPEAELTINGDGAIKLTATNNRGWNAYSSVISNQRGKLTVNGGTIEHLGGTDMAYAIDNLTNTGAQNAETVINGGTVKSTYRAIRQFLNSTSAQNVLTVNGGAIEGANKSIWMQGANANANPGALTVAAAAAIKGDVYLTTAAGTAEYPVVVAVAADALKDGAQVLTSNAPADFAVANVNGTWTKVAAAASLNGKGYATLRAAVEAAQNGETVELLANVTLAGGYEDATEGLRIEREITLNGNGHTIDCGTFQKGIRIYNLGNDGDFQVKFNNVEVVNNVANGRCIDTRSHDINLTITDSKLIAQNGNSQPLTIGGSEAIQRVKLDDAIIDAGNSGYGVIAFVPVKQNIYAYDNTKVTGYAAFYLKDHGNANIKLSLGKGTYIGKNIHSGASNAFGTVVLEGDNNILQIIGTNPTLKAITEGNASQAVVLVIGAKNKVSLESESATIDIEGENAYYGMISAENAGTTTIINKGNTMFPVAEVGGFLFMTIKEAIRYAGNEGTIKIVNDFVLAEAWTIPAGKNITLDLNGKTVSYTSAVAGEDMITNRGNLTITDSSDAKTGKLAYVNTDNTASNVTVSTISTEPGSTLVVDGGTIENKTVKADGSSIYSFAIDILTNGNLGDVNVTINGGTVYSDYMAIRQFNNGTACKNSLTINGGYIYGAKRAVQVHMDNNAAVTAIKGGKVEAGAEGYALCNFAATSDLAVTGGEFIGAVYSARENFISGGIYDAEVYAGYCAEGYMPNKNVDGTYGVVLVANAYASIDGVTYGSLKAAINAAKAGETITLLQDVAEGTVTVGKNLTIDGAGKTVTGMLQVNASKGYVTIKNVNFDGDNKTVYYAIRVDNANSFVAENCTADNYMYSFLYANKSNHNITVKDATVTNCADYGVYVASFNNATIENLTVTGAKYGVIAGNANSSKVNLKNCTFNGIELPLDISQKGTANVTFAFEGENEMGKAEFYTSQYVKVVAAAQVGTKVCGSLQDAVVAANDGETVKVLADVNMTTANFVTQVDGYATLVNVAGKAVTIDLNGKKVTVNAADADLNGKAKSNMLMSVFHADPNGTLTLTDSSAEGTGTVELFANDATVYGLIVSENAYDKSNPGKIIVNGGNYIADRLADSMIFADINEVITVNGGNFSLANVGTGNNGSPWIFNASGQNQIHINVNGGTYNANIAKQFYSYEVNLGEGLTTTNNGDGTWTVVPAVATVGEESFGSIQEAIDAAQDGQTVKLIADVTYGDDDVVLYDNMKVMNYVAGKNIILDLNEKTIDVTYNGGKHLLGVILVEDGAGLTVVGNGNINLTGTVGNGNKEQNIAYMFYKRGTTGYLVIENGTFHMNDAADSMVYTNGDEIVTINGGTFILDAVASQTNGFPVIFSTAGNNERQIVVNGGTFNYDINHQIRPFEVYVAPEKAVKKVGDMWTIVPAQAYVTEKLGQWVYEAGEYAHNVGYATVAEAIAATNELGKTVTILAGDYTGNLNVNKGVTVQGEVDENGNNLVTFNGKLNITADGATVKNINVNNGGNSAGYINAKNVVVDGCQVVGGNGFRSCYTSGTVTFKNSTITGVTYGIHFDGSANGKIVIENCTITGWTSFASTIENVTISGTTFAEGNYNQLRFYQNATITDCTFNEKMSVDFGKNGTTAAFNNCSVENGGNILDVIYIADIAEMGIGVTVDGVPVSVAAKVDGKYYLSLQAAIDAATEGQTVTIISDITLTEGVTVAADDNIFIDLNGKTVSMKDATAATAALIKNNGTLTIEDSSDAKAGKLSFETTTPSAANAYASNTISNYGTLTINAGTVENLSTGGACYALDNYAGSTATINGGKLTAEKTAVRVFNWTNGEANAAELNVVGGEIISNDGYGINVNAGNAPYVALNISGGTITTNDTDYNLAVYVVNKNSAENFTANISGGTFNGNLALNGVTSTTMAKGNVSVIGGTFDGVICYGEPACQFITGGSYMTEFAETYLAWGYQLTGDAAPYTVVETGRREKVTFIDGEFTEYTNEKDIEVGTLTYKRTINAAWQAFYVPFQVPVDSLAKLGFEVAYINGVRRSDYNEDGEFDSGFSMELIMIHGGKGNANGSGKTLKANYPYFIRPVGTESKELTIVLNDALLYAAEDVTYDCSTFAEKFEITGNSSQVVVNSTDDEFRYVVTSKGEWSKRTTPGNVKPFRFYMTVTSRDGSSPLVAEASMSIVVRGEELPDGTTVIYDVYDENIEDMIFDLQGRRVLETEKGGIYIKGGKKFIAQ